MNDKKISFIICCNNDFYLEECMVYLQELIIPDGFGVDVVTVTDAKSMTAGCNEGMRRTDAKYKIYMHQDVFITNPNFLIDLLEVFAKDSQIGLVGLAGTPYMVKSGIMWNGIRFGGHYRLEMSLETGMIRRFYPMKTGYMEMEAVDGLLMATQYDIPWREDLFKKWDFYDVSQSFEFQKAGYKVVLPGQSSLWYIHDCGAINLKHYDEEREIFLREYNDYMGCRKEMSSEQYIEETKKRVEYGFHGDEEEKQRLLTLVDAMDEEI